MESINYYFGVRGRRYFSSRAVRVLSFAVAPHAGDFGTTFKTIICCCISFVAPHAGAWIETLPERQYSQCIGVAPHAGAWIETWLVELIPNEIIVAPHAGAWIETRYCCSSAFKIYCRSSRRSVD
jgi:hypothetical protein